MWIEPFSFSVQSSGSNSLPWRLNLWRLVRWNEKGPHPWGFFANKSYQYLFLVSRISFKKPSVTLNWWWLGGDCAASPSYTLVTVALAGKVGSLSCVVALGEENNGSETISNAEVNGVSSVRNFNLKCRFVVAVGWCVGKKQPIDLFNCNRDVALLLPFTLSYVIFRWLGCCVLLLNVHDVDDDATATRQQQ